MTDDMKAKNRADRSGVVGTAEKETRGGSSVPWGQNTGGHPKFELQMGRK